jgi:predicted AlkP superfamily phosphohydrolase/phosphomutase
MTRTLFIGLDGATFTVLDELTSDLPGIGVTMPFLKQLMESGTRAKLLSTPNPLTPPAWVSLMTGRSPGHHGVFDFLRAEEKGDDVYFTLSDSRDIRTETLWSIASRQGKSVVALNFPITAPPRKINGSMVPGFVPWKHLRGNVTPPELFDRLKGMPEFNPKELAWDFDNEAKAMDLLGHDETEQWVRYHLPRERQWYLIAEKLMAEDAPDLMAVMFDGTDKIQHQAWAFLDPELQGQDDSDWGRRMQEICRDYFRNLDGYIERLVTAAGPDAQVFMASDHGFTTSVEVVRINTFLGQKGYLKWREHDGSAAAERRDKSWFANLDWHETLAYCRTPSSNGITIRVKQRPGDPGIEPHEYEAFRDKLIADLRSLRDEQTGEQIITEIHKREDIFPGPALKDAPDLTLVLRDYGFVSISNVNPVVQRRPVPVGTHHPDGVFLAFGPGVQRGVEVERRNIVDVTASMLYSLGLAIPSDFEGRVPESFFTDEYRAANPIRKGAPTMPVKHGDVEGGDIGEDEKAKIIEQLQMLGYME